jgi:O-acetyl-ADP-ribose deacetylase (regulator of RNase III)
MEITITLGDITKIKADAIVNAAGVGFGNAIGGGVAGAIRRAAGEGLVTECQQLSKERYPNGLPTGEATLTKGYNLPARFIIHTVGPRYYKEGANLLSQCYLNCLKLAEENNFRTIAFPAISTGAYGCPIEKSAEIVKGILENYKSKAIQEIILVLFKEKDYEVYKDKFK